MSYAKIIRDLQQSRIMTSDPKLVDVGIDADNKVKLLEFEVIELKEKLAKTTSMPCNWCIGTSETIDSMDYEIVQLKELLSQLEQKDTPFDFGAISKYLEIEAM